MSRSSELAILIMNGLQLVYSGVKSGDTKVTKHNVSDAVEATSGIIVLDAKGVYDALQNNNSTALDLTEKTKWNRAAGTQRQCRKAKHGS